MRLFFIICFVAVVAAGCKNNTRQNSEELLETASKAPGLNAGIGTFSVKTPDGWIKKDTTLNGIKILFIYAPAESNANFRSNLNIISESMGGFSYDEYVKKNLQTMQQYITSFHILDSGSIQVNDMRGKWIHYTQSQNGIEAENVFYILPKNGIAYDITSTTHKGDMDKHRKDFESIVETLQVQ